MHLVSCCKWSYSCPLCYTCYFFFFDEIHIHGPKLEGINESMERSLFFLCTPFQSQYDPTVLSN